MSSNSRQRGGAGARPGSARPPGVSKTLALYEELLDDVTDGTLAPGDRLSELALVQRYDVSRTPIREALVRLEQDGLVERRGTAVYVRLRSPEEVLDIYQVRVFLEGAVAHSAALRRTETDLIRLEGSLKRCASIIPDDPEMLQKLNTSFHVALAGAAHNVTLQELQGRLTRQVARLPSTTLSYPGRWETAMDEHRRLVEAVRDREADEAEAIARTHIAAARDIRLALMAEEMQA